jgi:hypothetical protein
MRGKARYQCFGDIFFDFLHKNKWMRKITKMAYGYLKIHLNNNYSGYAGKRGVRDGR